MPTILDINAFCKELKEVTSPKAWDKRNFNPNGLFSEQIFGPLKNYTCQCGKYYGVSKLGSICETCGVDIVNSIERRRRFSKIKLPLKVVNPIMYDLICDAAGTHVKGNLDKLMKDEKSILCKDEEGYYISDQLKSNVIASWDKTDAIYELVRYFSELYKKEDLVWKVIYENLHNLLMDYVIVLPPDLRPTARDSHRNNQYSDELNKYYTDILTKRESMRNTILDVQRDKQLYYTYYRQIQKDVNKLYDYILEKLSKKEGLLRNNILGKRVDFSGRAVITPDPSLNIDECVLPYIMVLEIFKLQIASKLIEIGQFKIFNEAADYISKCCEIHDESLFDVCSEVVKNEVCILNRQPSLHRLSMLGCKIKISLDNVIKIHPLICSPYNADFDGDQMAVYIPLSAEAKQEVCDKLLVSKNFTNPANGALSTAPGQDIVLGVYVLTSHKILKLASTKVVYKEKEISEDTMIFNECLPSDYKLIEDAIVKNDLIEILNDIKDKYDENTLAVTLDNIKEIGFKYATLYGTTMTLDAFYDDQELVDLKNTIYSEDDIKDQLMKICSKDVEDKIKQNFKYSYLISSGARGKWDQARQIIFSRGFISNFNGEILEEPVKHSLIEGLTQEEFFNSSYGCRKGLLDVAVNTGESGFISRKLIFTCVNLLLSEDLEDCGTTDCLTIEINSSKKALMLIGRYFYEDGELKKITRDNYKNYVGKTLEFRSPIYCQNDEICHICYGDLRKSFHSKFAGIISSQSLGETNTQLILRTFHHSGTAMIDKDNVNMKQADIISDLSAVSKLLHVRTKEKLYENLAEFTSDLFEVYNISRDIHHVHLESVICQMMWYYDVKWRLMPNRNKFIPQFVSIQSSPERESWVLGVAFSYPKRNLLKSITATGNYTGIMDKIISGEKLCS